MDVAWLLDTSLNKIGGARLVSRNLGAAYTVHVCSAGDNKEVGGVIFIAGPRLCHKRLKPLCTSGSSMYLWLLSVPLAPLQHSPAPLVAPFFPLLRPTGLLTTLLPLDSNVEFD